MLRARSRSLKIRPQSQCRSKGGLRHLAGPTLISPLGCTSGPPADGILNLDFVATPPSGLVLQILSKITVAKTFPVPAWVQGIRIHSSTDQLEARLAGAPKPSAAVLMGEGLPLPWPFPWWAPNSR